MDKAALFFWYLERQRFYRTLRKPSKMPTEIHGVSLLRGARLDGFARFLRAPCSFSEYIDGLVAGKETYKFQDADSLSHAHSHLLA